MVPAASSAYPLCVAVATLLALAPPRIVAASEPEEPPASAPPPAAPPERDPMPPEPAQRAEPPPATAPPEAPASEADAAPAPAPQESWLDVGHAFVEHRLFAPILRLDRFFSDERELEAERARSFVRFRNNLRVHAGTPVYTLDVAANLRFPGLNRRLERLRVVIAGQTDEAVSALLPEGPAAALRTSGVAHADAGLRYGAWEGVHSSLSLSAGAIVRVPPGVFGRVRYRASLPVRRLLLLRFAPAAFWRTDTHFGTSVDASAERPLGRSSLVRLENASQLTERSRGIEWSSGLAFLRTLTARSAISLAGVLEGAQRSAVAVERYRIFTRYRRDVLRHWIYLEVEPEVAWPWSEERGRYRELAVTFRVEVQFHGNEAPVPLPPELREPEDPAAPTSAGERGGRRRP